MTEGDSYRPPSRRELLQAALLAAFCALLFLGPAVLPTRALVPYPPEALEPLRTEALADGRVEVRDLLVGNADLGDKYFQSLAWDRIIHDRFRSGEWPLWTRDIGGGEAFVPQTGQVYQPWNLLLLALPAAAVYGLWFFMHQVLLGMFGYGFLRRIGARHEGALLGVVCLVVGLWTQARVHHNVILTAALPLFAMLSCVHELIARQGGLRAAALLGLATAMSWLGGMPQISLQASYLTGAWALLLTLRQPRGQRLRPLAWTALGLGLGVVASLGKLVPILLASLDSARQHATRAGLVARALEPDYLATLVWPDLLHWPGQTFYEGSIASTRPSFMSLLLINDARVRMPGFNYPETAFAIGIPALALALAGLGVRRHRTTILFFVGVALFGYAMASLPWPLSYLAMLLPGASSGDPKRWLYLCAVALPVLAAFGLDRLRTDYVPRLPWVFCASVAALSTGLLLLHLGSAGSVWHAYARMLSWSVPVPVEQILAQAHSTEPAANRTALLLCFSHGLVFAGSTLVLLRLRHASFSALALALLTALDLVLVGRGTFVAVARERVSTPPRILAPALASTRNAQGPKPRFQRLAGRPDELVPYALLAPNLGAFYGLEDMAAYNPLPPRRMEEFFSAIEPDDPHDLVPGIALGGAGVGMFRRPASLTHPLADLLGIRWILSGRRLHLAGLVDRTPRDLPGAYRLYERTTCLPRATFVTRARLIEHARARLQALSDRSRDSAHEVILEDPLAPRPSGKAGGEADGKAEIHFESYEDERVVLSVRNSSAGYLRLADPYDPGWTATVDGESVPIRIADHYLRAIWLEPSSARPHRVELRFDAARVVWPHRATLLGLILLLGLLLWPRRRTPEALTSF